MNPGDVVVQEMNLGGMDVRFSVKSFSVFENLMKPYTAIQALVVDSSNMLNNVMTGSNLELRISFGQPGQVPYTGKFAITSVEKGKTTSSLRTSTYTITGYSRHMTRMPRIEKSYREVTATDVVRDIVTSFLRPDKPVVVGDPSRGVMGNKHMPYNVNGVQVHKAIRAALERAIGKGSSYVFFESARAMNVDSLENLLDKAFARSRFTYTQRPLGHDWLRDQVQQNFTILSYREDSRSDKTDLVQALTQKINPLDFFSLKGDATSFGQGLASSIMNIAYDAMRPPTHLAQALPQRKLLAANFDSQSLTIHVPLNAEITVGDGFAVELTAPRGDTSFQERDGVSGQLLATEVRHSVDMSKKRMMGTTTIKGVKGGRT